MAALTASHSSMQFSHARKDLPKPFTSQKTSSPVDQPHLFLEIMSFMDTVFQNSSAEPQTAHPVPRSSATMSPTLNVTE